VAAGNDGLGGTTCALLTGGTIQCWGLQLGNGTNTDSNVPVGVTGITDAIAVAAGLYHSCALLTGGTIKCWGNNDYGELGNGTNTDSYVPVAVIGST
ncbi:MAG: RCC1 repeat-containing protein, partial [Acidimicrobiia bacterium]|nr:RCC1 repeat-containing protein [Acidimicrobiia bacterium]